jgi:hypothetical protein
MKPSLAETKTKIPKGYIKIEDVDTFIESWRDFFYHEIDGCEAEADDMLREWNELRKKEVSK